MIIFFVAKALLYYFSKPVNFYFSVYKYYYDIEIFPGNYCLLCW